MENPKSCHQCRHFSEGFCHLNPPPYAVVGSEDWCGKFSLVGEARGSVSKITDQQVLNYVESAWRPSRHPIDGREVPGEAYQRSMLIRDLMEHGVSHTPALKRIEKLVSRGLLMSGNDPHGKLSGICVWPVDKNEPDQPKRSGRPVAIGQDELHAMVGELAPSRESAVSLRAIHRAIGGRISLGALHGAVKALSEAGRIIQDDAGVYIAPAEQSMEVET